MISSRWLLNLAVGRKNYIWVNITVIRKSQKAALIMFDKRKVWLPRSWIVRIKRDRQSAVYLTQEYPSSQGYSYLQNINLKDKPAVMTWQENEQAFWVGIANMMVNRNYKNPTLFLNFKDKIDVRTDPKDSTGWVEMEPDSQYYIKLNGDLQPLVTYRLNPLFVKFPEKGDCNASFGIRGDSELPIDGEFLIKVR